MRPPSIRFTGLARVLRGVVLGMAVLLITIAGHTAGVGEITPDLLPLLILVPLSAAIGMALVDRRLSLAALVGYVVGGQVLMHIVLTVGFSHDAHDGNASTLIPGPRMLVGHAIASLLVLLVLIYGEDVLHRWLRFLIDLARAWDFTLAPNPTCSSSAVALVTAPLLTSQFRASVQRRGPPVTR